MECFYSRPIRISSFSCAVDSDNLWMQHLMFCAFPLFLILKKIEKPFYWGYLFWLHANQESAQPNCFLFSRSGCGWTNMHLWLLSVHVFVLHKNHYLLHICISIPVAFWKTFLTFLCFICLFLSWVAITLWWILLLLSFLFCKPTFNSHKPY